MKEVFKIVDNVVSKKYQDLIEHLLLEETTWFLKDNISLPNTDRVFYGAGRVFVHPPEPSDRNAPYFFSLLTEGLDKAGIDFEEFNLKKILRIASFYTQPGPTVSLSDVHVDTSEPHLVAIYYVTDSDGDTVITTSKFDGQGEWREMPHKETEVLHRVTPQKGRMVIFDGWRYHYSITPTKGRRCIVNYNIAREVVAPESKTEDADERHASELAVPV
jgi:hypothetical protein